MPQRANMQLVNNLRPFIAKIAAQSVGLNPGTNRSGIVFWDIKRHNYYMVYLKDGQLYISSSPGSIPSEVSDDGDWEDISVPIDDPSGRGGRSGGVSSSPPVNDPEDPPPSGDPGDWEPPGSGTPGRSSTLPPVYE